MQPPEHTHAMHMYGGLKKNSHVHCLDPNDPSCRWTTKPHQQPPLLLLITWHRSMIHMEIASIQQWKTRFYNDLQTSAGKFYIIYLTI